MNQEQDKSPIPQEPGLWTFRKGWIPVDERNADHEIGRWLPPLDPVTTPQDAWRIIKELKLEPHWIKKESKVEFRKIRRARRGHSIGNDTKKWLWPLLADLLTLACQEDVQRVRKLCRELPED